MIYKDYEFTFRTCWNTQTNIICTEYRKAKNNDSNNDKNNDFKSINEFSLDAYWIFCRQNRNQFSDLWPPLPSCTKISYPTWQLNCKTRIFHNVTEAYNPVVRDNMLLYVLTDSCHKENQSDPWNLSSPASLLNNKHIFHKHFHFQLPPLSLKAPTMEEVFEDEPRIVRIGGHDFVFVDELSPGQTCSICLLAMRSPVQTMCGHRFCESCLLETFRYYTMMTWCTVCESCISWYIQTLWGAQCLQSIRDIRQKGKIKQTGWYVQLFSILGCHGLTQGLMQIISTAI